MAGAVELECVLRGSRRDVAPAWGTIALAERADRDSHHLVCRCWPGRCGSSRAHTWFGGAAALQAKRERIAGGEMGQDLGDRTGT